MQRSVVVSVGLILAGLGVAAGVDAIVPWVFGIVDGVSWGELWRPIYNPEPMDTYAYRPLSVLLLKTALALTGRNALLMTAFHATALVAFGWVARGFLIRHGFERRIATLASVSAMAMPSLLFSAWIVVEFDLVGAVFVLAAANALFDYRHQDPSAPPAGRPKRHLLRFVAFAALAMTTKETSALALLAYLAASLLVARHDRRLLKIVVGYLAGLLICTSPMHFVDSGNTQAFTVWTAGFHPARLLGIGLHTAAQLVFVTSAAGVALLVSAALQLRRPWILLALTLLLFCAPVIRTYSHFEAVIFSSGVWTGLTTLSLVVAVALLIWRAEGLPRRAALWTLALTYLGYAAAPVVLRFARADVSARIFAAMVPLLHALVWSEVVRLWRLGRSLRPAAAVLGALMASFVVSAAVNTVIFHRTRLAVEVEAKHALARDIRMACPAFINTNPVQLLTLEQLRDAGARRLDLDCAWVQTTSTQPAAGWDLDTFAARGGVVVDVGQDAYLYIQTARSRMDAAANLVLAGNFDWTHGLLPESDDDMFAAYQRMIYEIETDIETLFRERGHRLVRAHIAYPQLPLMWNELPARLWQGVPWVESYDYVATVYRIPARQPGFVPSGGRRRRDAH